MQNLTDLIVKIEKHLNLLKEINSCLPDLTISSDNIDYLIYNKRQITQFRTKVDSNFDSWEFVHTWGGLHVSLFKEIVVKSDLAKTVGNKIRILISPGQLLIARKKWDRKTNKSTISFSKFSKDFVRYKMKFSDAFLNDCKQAIFKYIKDNPNDVVDTKNMHVNLKKLLAFV